MDGWNIPEKCSGCKNLIPTFDPWCIAYNDHLYGYIEIDFENCPHYKPTLKTRIKQILRKVIR